MEKKCRVCQKLTNNGTTICTPNNPNYNCLDQAVEAYDTYRDTDPDRTSTCDSCEKETLEREMETHYDDITGQPILAFCKDCK